VKGWMPQALTSALEEGSSPPVTHTGDSIPKGILSAAAGEFIA